MSVLRFPLLQLILLTVAALFIHGYHLGTEDGAIYIPAVRYFADPALYPFGREFFTSHSHLSLFSIFVGGTSRFLYVPVDAAVFLWQELSVFLTLFACRNLLKICFSSEAAYLGGLLLITVLLTLPATNTGLLLMDPYLTARSLSTPLTLLVIGDALRREGLRTAIWLVLLALIHPQMCAYALFFLFLAWLVAFQKAANLRNYARALFLLPAGFVFHPATGPYREVLLSRDYFFLANWTWLDWLGVAGPLMLLWWFSHIRLRGTLPAFAQICRATLPFGVISIVAAAVVSFPPQMQYFARLQPMRSFHLIYILFFLFMGALAAEYAFRSRPWLVSLPLALLAVTMFCVQRAEFPFSPHIEWPGVRTANPWQETFRWIEENTPKDAVFAIDPEYMKAPQEDDHGFRALTARSVLAGEYKDSGVAAMFPKVAEEWKREVQAQTGINHFSLADFQRLEKNWPVTWVVLETAHPPEWLDCPYRNQMLSVCKLPQ
uniref:DUF6798 domain-containing protein n=1 Tax=Paracidobacterium acidisoli TaxID=2303751 RepID=A0A372ITM9_9BACT